MTTTASEILQRETDNENRRKFIALRLGQFLALNGDERDSAARRLDVGCQFILNIHDVERACMTNTQWVQTALSNVRDNYLQHVVSFMLGTEWPLTQPAPDCRFPLEDFLSHCPFCGCTATWGLKSEGPTEFFISCAVCKAQGPKVELPGLAVHSWNRRRPTPNKPM